MIPAACRSDCGALINAWGILAAVWSSTGARLADTDVTTPTGGLFGGASLISVMNGEQVSYNADAIDDFFEDLAGDNSSFGGPATLHFAPGSSLPTLNQAESDNVALTNTSNVFLNGAVVTNVWNQSGGTAPRVFQPIDAVTALFMHDEIYNEYATESVVNGITEWAVTQPTKGFYVNNGATIGAYLPYGSLFDDSVIEDGGACEPVGISFRDREERDPGVSNLIPFSPSIIGVNVPALCYEAQTIAFNQDLTGGNVSAFFNSPNGLNIDTVAIDGDTFDSGWATIDFSVNDLVSGASVGAVATGTEVHTLISADAVSPRVYVGLPVTGFAVQVSQNGTLVGDDGGALLSNYAGLFNHRSSRRID